jgi:hypothetical protein
VRRFFLALRVGVPPQDSDLTARPLPIGTLRSAANVAVDSLLTDPTSDVPSKDSVI